MESSLITPSSAALALIPARGGSKGIPGKNLQPIGGRPLVLRSIQAAQTSRGVGRVVVSTDDHAIRSLALEAGAEVVSRPEAIAGGDPQIRGSRQCRGNATLRHGGRRLGTPGALVVARLRASEA